MIKKNYFEQERPGPAFTKQYKFIVLLVLIVTLTLVRLTVQMFDHQREKKSLNLVLIATSTARRYLDPVRATFVPPLYSSG